MAKKKLKFTDVIHIPETCTSDAIINSVAHMSTKKKHVIMMFAKEAEELSEEGNGILLSDEGIKVKYPSSEEDDEEYIELELSAKQKAEMKSFKDFTEITRIRDLSELSDALSEAGSLLYVQNNSSFTFLDAMTQAFLFEAEYGHRSKHEAGAGKSYFAYCLRILVPNRIAEEIYSALASFALLFFGMQNHIYAVFAERKGSGTYIRIIVTARQFYPEGIEKKRFATSRTVRNLETGRIRNLKADAEVPENCVVVRKKGDLVSCKTVFFGNKDGGFAVSKGRFNTLLEKFKKEFRKKLKTIGYAVHPKFCFSKVNESKISKTAFATHHAACAINDTLNFVETEIEEFRENVAMYGLFISDEDIYKEAYKPFYDKVERFISDGKPVVSYVERETYEPITDSIQTMIFPYFFSLVAKYAKNAVYASMTRFLYDFEVSLQKLKNRVFGGEITPLEAPEIFYEEMEKKEEEVRTIRPRLKKMHDRLEEISLRRLFGSGKRDAQEELEEEYQEYLTEIMGEEIDNYTGSNCEFFNKSAAEWHSDIQADSFSDQHFEEPDTEDIMHFKDEDAKEVSLPFEMSEAALKNEGLEAINWEDSGERMYPVFVDTDGILEGQLAFANGTE